VDERERERQCGCVREREGVCEGERKEGGERDKVCVFERVKVRERERGRRGREGVREREERGRLRGEKSPLNKISHME